MNIQFSNCLNYFGKRILGELKEVCQCWVAGGCVRDYFSIGYISSDIDLFFPNDDEYKKARAYFLDGDTPKAKLIFENENATKIVRGKQRIDLCRKYFASPKDTIDAFDFTVACGAVTDKYVITHETFFIDLSRKALVINKLPYPISTISRMQKYIKKGYHICNGGILEIAKEISKLDMEDQKTIEAAIEFYPDGTPKYRSID